MANELSVEGGLHFIKGEVNQHFSRRIRETVAGSKYAKVVQTVAITEEPLLLGDITSPGRVMIENLDAVNFVSVRAGAGLADLIKIPPGSIAGPFYLASAAPYVIADTEEVEIQTFVIEQ